jgi:hypothetical protein
MRRFAKVQVLNPPDQSAAKDGRWWQGTPAIDQLSVSLAGIGLAVGEDGKAVFATSETPTELIVFDRQLETGRLSVRGTKSFHTERERAEFLSASRRLWDTTRQAREERQRECAH